MIKQRTTSQRRIILAAVKKNKNHPTADAVYADVYQENPKISRGTVYRNLHVLAKNGEINHVPIAEGADCFDYRTDPHYHFRCKICGGIWDADLPYMANLNTAAAKNQSFSLDEHHILFRGVCQNCNKKIKDKRAE